MDVSTPAGLAQPLDFEGKRGRHQLFVNTELPLTRKLERNNYRSSLIAYQRQRRNLMATEDQTLFQVRQNLRELHRQSADYLIQQRAVDLAHRNFDSSLEVVEQGTGDPAAQTQRLLGNVNAIVQAENGIIQAWITYIRTRMRLYRDLELLRVDSRGVWIDEYSTPVSTPAVQPVP
jgi:outer membrane protein TolC